MLRKSPFLQRLTNIRSLECLKGLTVPEASGICCVAILKIEDFQEDALGKQHFVAPDAFTALRHDCLQG